MAPRSKIQKEQAGRNKRAQREKLFEYGLQEVTVYVPKNEVAALRNRSRKLVAAARAKTMLDNLGEEEAKAIKALSNKDFEQFDVTQPFGSDEPYKDHIHPRTSKSADTSLQAPQIPPSRSQMQPSAPAATSSPAAVSAPTLQPALATRPPVIPQRPDPASAASPLTPSVSDAEMTAMLAEANGLMYSKPR